MSNLPDLIAALESASEGSAELDERVGRAFGWWYDFDNAEWVREGEIVEFLPVYSRSVDAALTLKPKDACWLAGTDDRDHGAHQCKLVLADGRLVEGRAATPALSICAAALRRRSARPRAEKGEGK